MEQSIKQCSNKECKVPIVDQEFGKDKSKSDNLTSRCKICNNRQVFTDEQKLKRAEYGKAYRASDKGKKTIADYLSKPEVQTRIKTYQSSEKAKEWRKVYNSLPSTKDRVAEHGRTAKAKETQRLYDQRDYVKEKKRKYNKSVEGKLGITANRHRRREKINTTSDKSVNKSSLQGLLLKQGNRCYHCNSILDHSTEKAIHLDHLIPLSREGTHTISNVVWSCATCNLEKSNKIL